uniref:Uncharacterized protein n=1 Tax=Panagrolaimus davidi TaxID=227884 RepID=A0A914PH26_9BILA
MSWMEFGHLEYDSVGFYLAPFLAIAQGINVVILKKSYKTFISSSPQSSFEIFSLFHSGLVSVGLALPALISYLKSVISYDASWEIIDYVLISMSVVFMACYKFSEYWLIFNTDLSVYFCLEHTKFFIGSIGQWFLQNMAHASVYAGVGKMLFVTSSIQFWQANEKADKKAKHENTE